ncbi:MAG TPA: AAA domain-containing protein [Ktedonobacterales bacterium]
MRASEVDGDGISGTASAEAESGCFLCALTPRACDVPSVEGRLLRIHVPPERDRAPHVLLARDGNKDGDDGDGELRLRLPLRTRALATALVALPPDALHRLRLRAFHLSHPAGESGDSTKARLVAGEASAVVLEPDLLLNITDLNNGEYCVRQYPLRQLVPSPPNAATLRGTAIHAAFKELLKGGTAGLDAYFEQALQARAADLALQRVPAAALRDDSTPHLRALDAWHAHQHATLWGRAPDVRAETFLLAPQIGLKGRLDFLLAGTGGDNLLELKTGNAHAALPRREHRWQVYGYLTLLAVLRPRDGASGTRPLATLLYSGTPGRAEGYGVAFTLRDLLRVLDLRNQLALVHATGRVPPPPGGKTCARCALREPCLRTSPLLGWQPPQSDERPAPVVPSDAANFATHYDLLRLERQAGEGETAALWKMSPWRRVAAGIALDNLELDGEPTVTTAGEWEYRFRCLNESELREGDEILLSEGDPVRGEVVSGTILRLGERGVTVWTPERISHPRLIDRYASDITAHRTLRNLWRWLEADPRLRALVAGERPPRFGPVSAPALDDLDADFNAEQRAAVALALSADDYALVQGPPGTGKTRVVAAIARRAMARGDRVLLAAFTNQAVDNVLLRLLAEGRDDAVRLGHELSVAPRVRGLRLAPRTRSRLGLPDGAPLDPAAVRATLLAAPLVAATTATWSAERYDGAGDAVAFDLALVDEASQLTLPALLGALRFARRFVLVGDDQQLPPLVLSREAAERGLGRSVLAMLMERWGAVAGVRLERQYRMHPIICGFPSAAFYDGLLAAEGTARTAQLDLALTPSDPLAAVLAPERPLVFVDVPSGGEPAGKVSDAQARVVRALVLALRAADMAADEIAVIAPYRAQVAAIRRRLAARGEAAVAVDTVDRFQGAERPVVIFAFGGRTSPAGATTEGEMLARSGGDFIAEPRRLNVALTRAQRKLILVGDRAWLERQSPLLARLVGYCRGLYGERGGIVRAGVS